MRFMHLPHNPWKNLRLESVNIQMCYIMVSWKSDKYMKYKETYQKVSPITNIITGE